MMSILKGMMSYTRFFVKSESPLSLESIAEKLNLFKFRPLHERGEDNEALGWCVYLSEYEHEKSIQISDFSFDDKIVMSVRFDSIALPKDLLKSLVKRSLNDYQKEYKKFPDKVVRKEIELAEAKGLRAKILPKTKILESIWCQKSGELRVFSRSSSQIERYLELFQDTFMLRPERRDFQRETVIFGNQKKFGVVIEQLSHKPIFLPQAREIVE